MGKLKRIRIGYAGSLMDAFLTSVATNQTFLFFSVFVMPSPQLNYETHFGLAGEVTPASNSSALPRQQTVKVLIIITYVSTDLILLLAPKTAQYLIALNCTASQQKESVKASLQ